MVPSACYEVILGKPDKSDVEATRKKLQEGLAILKAQDGFSGVVLEGVQVEDASVTLRVLEWNSYEASKHFRSSSSYAEYTKSLEAAYDGAPTTAHYTFATCHPFTPMPAVVEYLAVTLLSAASYPSFLPAFTHAMRYTQIVSNNKGFSVGHGVEDPGKVMGFVAWDSVEQHGELPESEGFPLFWTEMGGVLDEYVSGSWGGMDMWHVKTCEPGSAV